MEIGCFAVCVSGWILVCSTMPTEIWTWSEVGSIVLTTSNYFSNLWKDCISDSTGVSDCKGIPSMLALNWDIHMCRALIIICIILSFFGSILVLVGMKCTKIGGTELANARVTFAGGMNYLIGGMCSMVAFSYYGNKIRSEFQDPTYKEQKRWCFYRLGRLYLTCCRRPYLQYLCRERRVSLEVKCCCCISFFSPVILTFVLLYLQKKLTVHFLN
uniref:Claudin n=1 Tax=Amphiprion percula TaxID=161767 RepID=A0A3P8UCV7_AMPPE